jgi:hypothetical protein
MACHQSEKAQAGGTKQRPTQYNSTEEDRTGSWQYIANYSPRIEEHRPTETGPIGLKNALRS